jgi:hypothetical protein
VSVYVADQPPIVLVEHTRAGKKSETEVGIKSNPIISSAPVSGVASFHEFLHAICIPKPIT